ncbi:MAG: transglycosylase domain-containing protein [Acidimicrobiales bacterium]
MRKHAWARLLTAIVASAVFAAGAAIALSPAAGMLLHAGTGQPLPLFLNPLEERSQILDRNGALLATLYGEQNRAPVPLASIPQQVVDAVLAVEDEHFYDHEGVNLRATVRALFENVSSGSIEQGASTITMQVVENSVVSDEGSLTGKSREAVLAVRLEEEFTKDQILERYLNTVYFGNGAYGVQAAAETYWGVSVGDLGWGQAALLAALIRQPVTYDPVRAPDVAAERRRLALNRIVAAGHLTPEQAAAFATEPLPTEIRRITPPPDDYYVEQVKLDLLRDPRFGLGDTPEERYNAVFSGGLRIHTTFDPAMQQAALQARNDVLPGDLDGQFLFPRRDDVIGTAVVVTVDTGSGAVRTLVGGPGFDNYRYNIATQGIGRQTGSAAKVFVLAAALESGLVPNDSISGSGPCRFANPGGRPDPYVARNFGNSGGGSGTVLSQTTRSSNCAFLRLGQVVGLERVIEVARRMGITTELEPHLSLPIGVEEVRPLEMTGAIASLGNDGIHNQPYFIERIEDPSGNVLYQHEADSRRAVSRQTARLATEVLMANVRGGTGTAARLETQPAAGKTGTAQDSADAWFVGYTPQYATSVWMGATTGRVGMYNIGGRTVTGGSYPARIWGQYMNTVLSGTERVEFPDPEPTRSGRSLTLPRQIDLSAPSPTRPPSATTTATTGLSIPPSETTPPTTAPPPPPPTVTVVPPPTVEPPDVGD